jgi:HEAT repeat protein
MSVHTPASANLESLLGLLASDDGMLRQQAREALVALGAPAVPPLITALESSTSQQVRWEAAKALGVIGDVRSIAGLVSTLAEGDSDVAWVAAVALTKFKQAAWPQMLHALMKDEKSYGQLRQGVHHVLVNQQEAGFDDLLATLLQALDTNGVQESAISAASKILKRMKEA